MSTSTLNQAAERIPAHSWYALGVLTFVYVLNFLDRVLMYSLFPLIKQEFQFSDLQPGLLGATAFTIFYTMLGIPFGRMADRVSRKGLIAAGLAVWSLFSGLTGFAWNFETMFLCRLMVGVGEATLGPAAADGHEIAGPQLRGLGVGIYFFSGNLAAYGLGASLIGYLSDLLGASGNPALGIPPDPSMMRYALLVCPAASALAALLLWRGSRLLTRQDGEATKN